MARERIRGPKLADSPMMAYIRERFMPRSAVFPRVEPDRVAKGGILIREGGRRVSGRCLEGLAEDTYCRILHHHCTSHEKRLLSGRLTDPN